ncbi:MAG: GtrA family protein [Hydrogenibacillus sp.]|nr:GtrA family protein [Hydrogenibacillus sp.]
MKATSAALLRQAVRYLLVGVVNTAVGTGTMLILILAAGISYWPATAIGFALGVLVSFTLNRAFTFRHRGEVRRTFARFVTVTAVGYVVTFALAHEVVPPVVRWILGPSVLSPEGVEAVAAVFGTGLYTGLTFLAHRAWTFNG